MKIDFTKKVENLEEMFPQDSTSDWFKITEGENRIRIMTDGEIIAEHFKKGVCVGKENGCESCKNEEKPSVKFLFWVLDYRDSKLKLAKLPYSIFKMIASYQKNPEYSFDSVPVPYDFTITAKNAGTKEVEYGLIPARKETLIDEKFMAELSKKRMPNDIVQAMKDKVKPSGDKKTEKVEYPENTGEEIPF